jgi:hypothetical protein
MFADDLCVMRGKIDKIETVYSDDFASGTLSSAPEFLVHFYLGWYPDRSGVIDEKPGRTKNPHIRKLDYLKYSDGSFAAMIRLVSGPERDVVMFRSTQDLSVDETFQDLLDSLKRCRVR